jgi:hypothetical protein
MRKLVAFRSENYRAWLKQQPCVVCHRPAINPSHAHHEPLGENFVGGKPPDTHGMPLCGECHYDRHQYGAKWLDSLIDPKMTIIKHITRFLSEGRQF